MVSGTLQFLYFQTFLQTFLKNYPAKSVRRIVESKNLATDENENLRCVHGSKATYSIKIQVEISVVSWNLFSFQKLPRQFFAYGLIEKDSANIFPT